MRPLTTMLVLLVYACPAAAEEEVAQFSWSDLHAEGRIMSGEIVPAREGKPFESLAVENPDGGLKVFTVLTVDRPEITGFSYALVGQVSYEDVEDRGYLEMWSYFPGGAHYFSRTLGASGPMQSLEGSSDWRPFALQFFAEGNRPEKLVLNVVLPAKGKVQLSPVRLVQYQEEEAGAGTTGRWWSRRQGN